MALACGVDPSSLMPTFCAFAIKNCKLAAMHSKRVYNLLISESLEVIKMVIRLIASQANKKRSVFDGWD